jgi:hypothetical protein
MAKIVSIITDNEPWILSSDLNQGVINPRGHGFRRIRRVKNHPFLDLITRFFIEQLVNLYERLQSSRSPGFLETMESVVSSPIE